MMLLNITDGDEGAVNDGGSVLNVKQHKKFIFVFGYACNFNVCRSMP